MDTFATQTKSMVNVFTEFEFRNGQVLKNRLAVAPMTTQQSNANGSISKEETDWLNRLSEDGFGMVISCAASISDTATAFYNQLSLAHDSYIPELQKTALAMKQNGSINLIQLCHAGSRAIEQLTGERAHSASRYTLAGIPGFVPPEELTKDQISRISREFALACKRAEQAGFDGIELHGANGYLFTQFISTMTNLRKDEYGGSLENRARFSREVVRACRKAVSDRFIIGFRLSFENIGIETGLDVDENIQIANWLAEDGIDYIHSSQMNYAARCAKYPEEVLSQYIKKHLSPTLPLVIPGSIMTVESAQDALNLGADIVAVGRAAIGNRQIPQYFKNNQELPFQLPYSENQLKQNGVSDNLIRYLKEAPPLRSLNIIN